MSSKDVWVVNASPLIVLAKARYHHLLSELADEVIIPDVVADEILKGDPSDPARLVLETGWPLRVSGYTVPQSVLDCKIGPGETAVISVALARGECLAVIDDRQGRNCATSHGVDLLGTLGVVLLARTEGLITSAAAVCHSLKATGWHIDDRLIEQALHRVGEVWP
ncbi:MAG TPA: DUF3368 domain-containing protein [Chthonomonadaceae bacterium]|nr:DUF3368 domain-containing protein [Chthonomonadaceae bacterium]